MESFTRKFVFEKATLALQDTRESSCRMSADETTVKSTMIFAITTQKLSMHVYSFWRVV